MSAVAKPYVGLACYEDEVSTKDILYGLYGLIMQINVECHLSQLHDI